MAVWRIVVPLPLERSGELVATREERVPWPSSRQVHALEDRSKLRCGRYCQTVESLYSTNNKHHPPLGMALFCMAELYLWFQRGR